MDLQATGNALSRECIPLELSIGMWTPPFSFLTLAVISIFFYCSIMHCIRRGFQQSFGCKNSIQFHQSIDHMGYCDGH